MADLAFDALAWICGEGQRNCEHLASRHGRTCPEWDQDGPEDWCDVCIAGAAWFSLATANAGRLCARCSHLYDEHTHPRPILNGSCDCCRCPCFIDEPDFSPSLLRGEG